ncbi:calcium-translocating P-type ATPase, PMCA-type [Gallibacter intestinalis]|uniref:P-type Ca(2+) transporter n=1 Tax=Gallibacter intestinalis TaxID=2779356 RepID=A0ABR9QVY0_9FIRM|nr:calcium-translocating P-type ATPase, PMCA-type [Gallibacter intestinalis]MBE5035025.1 calcium-translocating P-type ATPase, PMCA-type [Gallibacter intestinalis]
MFYNKSSEEVLKEFESSTDGLSEAQVTDHREKYGENKLQEKKKKSTLLVFAEQFKDLLVIILIVAALISIATGDVESTVVILAVITLNAILGTVQYVKAEKSLESLKKLSAPVAKVIRDGQQLEIPASELVVGDIIKLEAGDVVPSDGRLLEAYSLKINESALTGESEAVEKDPSVIDSEKVALGDQKNMVFSSSLVTYGRGLAVITAVGHDTELGKIADLISNTAERKTPLQVNMDNFSKKLSIIIILICVLVFGLSVYRGETIMDALLFAVALAVAAIPEALSSIITISLAIGTSRMAKENAIVKELKAVEGLGCVSIICSDKTGTLTQNKMTVEDVYCYPTNKQTLLISSIMCNDTAIVDGETFGDPTETAFVDYYMANNDDYTEMMATHPRIGELPFDSERKLMSTLHDMEGKITMFTKGAPDVLIERCGYFLDANGQVALLNEEEKEKIKQKNFDYSSGGLRVLAFAMKTYDALKELNFDDEKDLVFIGLEAEMDPPRVESAPAVADCIKAGIKPIMITGDHKVTASAIAKKIGILQDGDKAITGPELDEMDDETLAKELPHISVYARVSPDNKIRIVNAWQELGHIVAMTGDGVNDAPALKQADIGIAMGITGTEVSKDASAMILTDDNFATIIKSVLNGRNIYANIKNAIKFLLSGNAAGIFSVLYASLAGLPAPFAAVHLLFINLLTDSLPALAISMEPSNEELIKDKPRSRDESILTKAFVGEVGFQGILIAIATMAAFYIGYETSTEAAMTMAFSTLCLARLWHGFNSRGKQSIFKLGLTTNVYTIGAFFLGLILLSLVLFVPFLEEVFSVAVLSWAQIGWIALLAFLPTVVIQIKKIIVDHMENK